MVFPTSVDSISLSLSVWEFVANSGSKGYDGSSQVLHTAAEPGHAPMALRGLSCLQVFRMPRQGARRQDGG